MKALSRRRCLEGLALCALSALSGCTSLIAPPIFTRQGRFSLSYPNPTGSGTEHLSGRFRYEVTSHHRRLTLTTALGLSMAELTLGSNRTQLTLGGDRYEGMDPESLLTSVTHLSIPVLALEALLTQGEMPIRSHWAIAHVKRYPNGALERADLIDREHGLKLRLFCEPLPPSL